MAIHYLGNCLTNSQHPPRVIASATCCEPCFVSSTNVITYVQEFIATYRLHTCRQITSH